ncbi:MAG: LamG domain-containing protein, partial [Pseudomonadales bacterium]
GVGEKYYLLFNVSDHVDIVDAYVVFQVSQYDSYAYLFDEPFFVVLDDAGVTLGNIPLRGMRIGLNGREVNVGQAYANIDESLNDVDYAVEGFQRLSTLGTVIALEKGPDLDEFFLTFERLAGSDNAIAYAEPFPDPLPPPPDVPSANQAPPTGVRDFAEINATMSKMTGVPMTSVATIYDRVYQAMPVQPKIAGFISSQQMGISQLAFEYCSVLVDDPTARLAFWPAFPWGTSKATAFNDRSSVITPLLNNIVGLSLPTQPALAAVTSEVNDLIDILMSGNADTNAIMKGSCASALGSAAMLVQ